MPGNKIPDPFKWDSSFQTFYAKIDDEHKGLFDGIAACCATNDQATYAKLVTKVKNHFATEEALFNQHKYEFKDVHKGMHDDFVGKLPASAPLDEGTVLFAKDWLVNHIKDSDFKYKGKLGK